MAPKPQKREVGILIDGVDTTSMTRGQLEVFAIRIKEENEREREERKFFQLERDKLRAFWEITRNELDQTRAKLRFFTNKDRQIEEERMKNYEELKFYKQKVKHLELEYQNRLTDSKIKAMVSLKKVLGNHDENERELLKDKRDIKHNKNLSKAKQFHDQETE